MAIADYGGDARNRGKFLGGPLGVAASGNNAGCRVEAMGAANVGASFAVGFGGDATGVDDDHIGFGGLALVGVRSPK